MGRHKAAATRLEQARAAHAAAERRIGQLEDARIAALLSDDDDKAARLDAELEAQRRLARGHRDKAKLIGLEAEREAAAERVRRHEAHIKQVEKLGEGFVAAGTKLAAATAVLVEAYREAITVADKRGAAWPWGPQDQAAALLTPQSVCTALSHEFHRVSRVPFLGGRPGEKPMPSLPGALCSRPTDWLNLPEKETPLIDVFRDAAQYASQCMRQRAAQPEAPPLLATNGNSTGLAAPAADKASPSLADTGTLGELLRRQAEFAADTSPAGEAEYQKIVQQISTLQ
jgi:hypothetical protein